MKAIRVRERPAYGWGQVIGLEPRFTDMIARLETQAATGVRGYARRVVAAGLLGYVVLGAMMALLTLLVLGTIAVLIRFPSATWGLAKLALPIGALVLSLARALRIETPEPEGIAVNAAETPALHALVDRMRNATGGPRIHEVRITNELNAAITQQQRMILGSRNTLYIGLPLLQAMREAEIAAIVAHEMGHFVGRHGHASAFAYRIRMRWMQVAEHIPDGVVAGVLRRFFGWYGPWFAAYSFVLARRHEYEADAISAAVAGKTVAADALVRVTFQADRRHEGWQMIWSQAHERPDPPRSPGQLFGETIFPDTGGDPQMVLDRALAEPPGLDDTHPSLAQRLAALGVAPALPAPLEAPAAPALLGTQLATLIDAFDAEWHANNDTPWAELYEERQTAIADYATLRAEIDAGPLDHDAHFRFACHVETFEGSEAAVTAFAAMLAAHPEANEARYRQGDALLDLGDASGIALLEEAAAIDPAFRIHALERILRHAIVTAQPTLAEEYRARLDTACDDAERARVDSGAIDEKVVFRPLDPDQRDRIAAEVAAVGGVERLDMAVRDMAFGPQIVFVFKAAKSYTGTDVLDGLIEVIQREGDVLGVERSFNHRWLAKRIERVAGSRVV